MIFKRIIIVIILFWSCTLSAQDPKFKVQLLNHVEIELKDAQVDYPTSLPKFTYEENKQRRVSRLQNFKNFIIQSEEEDMEGQLSDAYIRQVTSSTEQYPPLEAYIYLLSKDHFQKLMKRYLDIPIEQSMPALLKLYQIGLTNISQENSLQNIISNEDEDLIEGLGQIDRVKSLIINEGEKAIPYIHKIIQESGVHTHELLRLYVEIGSKDALKFLKPLILEENLLSFDAATSYRLITGEEGSADIKEFVNHVNDHRLKSHLIDQLFYLNRSDWCKEALDLWIINPSNSLTHVQELNRCPLDNIRPHISRLIHLLDQKSYNRASLAFKMLARLEDPSDLDMLFPILEDLMKFEYGACREENFNDKRKFLQSSRSAIRMMPEIRKSILYKIMSVDEDVLVALYKESDSQIVKFFIAQQIYEEGMFETFSQIHLASSVIELDSQKEVAAFSGVVNLGQPLRIEFSQSTGSQYQPPDVEMKISWNDEKNLWDFSNIRIPFKPHGVGFDFSMPFGGTYEIHLSPLIENKRETYIWRFEHHIGECHLW